MYLQELLFLMQCLLGIFMLIILRKITQLKKQVDTITKEVIQYLDFVEGDIEVESLPEKKEKRSDLSKDEMQNHLIQAVLREYFP